MSAAREPSEFFEKVGLAATVMGKSPQYCEYPIACIQLWLEPAIRHNQIKFFSNESGVTTGYITWAWLAEDTEFRLINDSGVLLHISEWNEGDRLWILDFVLLSGDLRARLRDAAALFKTEAHAKSLRRRDDGTVRKVTTWRKKAFESTSRARK